MQIAGLLFALAAQAAAPGPWLEADVAPIPVEMEEEPDLPSPACNDQSLRNGIQLPDRPELWSRIQPGAAWGTPEMIEVITSAAEQMAWLRPDAKPIAIGDISHKRGGRIEGHKSHRGGIDADIGLYGKGGTQGRTRFPDLPSRELDLEANWLFLKAMLDTGLVQRVLLDQTHIDSLRRYTIEAGHLTEDEAYRIFTVRNQPRVWAMKGVVSHAPSHRDHFHVRVVCVPTGA